MNKKRIIYGLVSVGTVASGIAGGIVFADGTDVVDQVNITVPVSCTMEGTGMNTHNATIPNGIYSGTYTDPDTSTSYANGIGTTTLKAMCNDNEGFSIYAIGYTDNTDGKNVLTNSTLGSTFDIPTGTNTGPVGNVDTSNWAMKLSTITSPTPTYPIIIAGSTADTDKAQGDPDYSSFQEVPDDYVKVAYRKSATDVGQNAIGSELTTTYAVYISKTQPAGVYTGQVKYTLVHPYNAAAPEIPESPSTSCTTPVSDEVSGITYMQDINSTNISTVLTALHEDEPYYLRDKRDNQPYCVAKLKDGKLWMTEDLNIAGGTALSSTDTDFDANYTLPTTNGWTVNDGKLVLPASATKNSENNNLTDSTQFGTDNYAYVFNSGNKTNCGASSQNAPCYSYYSWDTATLGSGRSISTDNTDADYSICPKNWKLPTSRTTSATNWQTESDFYVLAHQYGLDSTTQTYENDSDFYDQAGPGTTPNFLLAGSYAGGSFSYGGSLGLYWSASSYSNSTYAHILFFSSSGVYSSNDGGRRYGLSVRCLFGS